MRARLGLVAAPALLIAGLVVSLAADPDAASQERLAHHRNLGKAFYENPTTREEAVSELKQALDLNPESARDRLNYGLALLGAGQDEEGVAEIEAVQRQDPTIPHTWFNLGIQYKRLGEFEKSRQQFERMVQLAPDDAISHYNLGALYKLEGRNEEAIQQFRRAAELDPSLAAPHFQLFNTFRQAGEQQEAAAELEIFQTIKKQQEGAAVPEDMDWSLYSELLDPIEPPGSEDLAPPAELRFSARDLDYEMDPATANLEVVDADADGRPDLLAWSSRGARLFSNGQTAVRDAVLDALTKIRAVSAGDFDNDGLPDLAVATDDGSLLLHNTGGHFARFDAELPSGLFDSIVWLDFDHDDDVDLFLLGPSSVLMRNQGTAGFVDRTSAFPFVSGHPSEAVVFRLIPDTKAMDLAVAYSERTGVLYRDRLNSTYDVEPLDQLPAGARGLDTADIDNNGSLDLTFTSGNQVTALLYQDGLASPVTVTATGKPLFADLGNRGIDDLVAGGHVFRNLSGGAFSSEETPSGFLDAAVWTSADFDADGLADLTAVARNGSLQLLTNETSGDYHWIRVALLGQKAPQLAPGAEVEVKAGLHYQKRLYRGYPIIFGLGHNSAVDTVRITWPNGLMQNETNQPVDRAHVYKEAERLAGSCPTIWTWNGKQFEFITDVLGVAPLGASAGDGTYFPTDHDEYVQIAGDSLVAENGRYEIRITEELSEVSYLDHVKLIAVDHPLDVAIFTNEKFQGPPFPEFKLFGVRRRLQNRVL